MTFWTTIRITDGVFLFMYASTYRGHRFGFLPGRKMSISRWTSIMLTEKSRTYMVVTPKNRCTKSGGKGEFQIVFAGFVTFQGNAMHLSESRYDLIPPTFP